MNADLPAFDAAASGPAADLDLAEALRMANVEMEAAAETWTQSMARTVRAVQPEIQVLHTRALSAALAGRQVCATLNLEGERSGESYWLLAERDAQVMTGLFSMMPAGEIDAKALKHFAWEDFDAFGEIMNQMAGAARALLTERLHGRYELTQATVTVVDSDDADALLNLFGERELIAIRYGFTIDGYVDASVLRLFGHALSESFRRTGPETDTPTSATVAHAVDSFAGVAEMLGAQARNVLETRSFDISENAGKPAESSGSGESALPEQIDRILHISLPVRVAMASKPMTIGSILNLTSGSLIEFDRSVDAPLSLQVDERTIAEGRAVVSKGRFALELSRVVPLRERIQASD